MFSQASVSVSPSVHGSMYLQSGGGFSGPGFLLGVGPSGFVSGGGYPSTHLPDMDRGGGSADTYWQPPHVRWASGQYASYWNAFLFLIKIIVICMRLLINVSLFFSR